MHTGQRLTSGASQKFGSCATGSSTKGAQSHFLVSENGLFLTLGLGTFKFLGQKITFLSLAANGAAPVNVSNTEKVSHWFPDMRIPKVVLHPPKEWIFGPKRAKFGPKYAFLVILD